MTIDVRIVPFLLAFALASHIVAGEASRTNLVSSCDTPVHCRLPFNGIIDDASIYNGQLDETTLEMTAWLAYAFARYDLASFLTIIPTTNGLTLRRAYIVNAKLPDEEAEGTTVERCTFRVRKCAFDDELYVLYKFYGGHAKAYCSQDFIVAIYVNVHTGLASLSIPGEQAGGNPHCDVQPSISNGCHGHCLLNAEEKIIQDKIAELLLYEKMDQMNRRLRQYSEDAKRLLNHRKDEQKK